MPAHYRAWKAAAEENGLTFEERQFYALAGKPASAVLAVLNEEQGKNVPLEKIRAVKTQKLALEKIDPISPVVQLAMYAKEKGKRVAVASGGHRENVYRSLRAIGIKPEEFFHAVVVAEDVTNGKPHPETFLTAAERIGVDPKKCVGFEDGVLGLEALNAAGMTAVDVRELPGYPVPDVLKTAK